MQKRSIKAEIAQIAKIRKEKAAIEKTLKKKVSQLFQQQAKELFDNHSELESFMWSQYTPYFNDGEECKFYAYRDSIGINGEEMVWITEIENDIRMTKNKDKKIATLLADINKLKEAITKKRKKVTLSQGEYPMLDDGWKAFKHMLKERTSELEYYQSFNPDDLPALKKRLATLQAISGFLNEYTNEDLLEMFGDHAVVTVTRKNCTVEYYNHD